MNKIFKRIHNFYEIMRLNDYHYYDSEGTHHINDLHDLAAALESQISAVGCSKTEPIRYTIILNEFEENYEGFYEKYSKLSRIHLDIMDNGKLLKRIEIKDSDTLNYTETYSTLVDIIHSVDSLNSNLERIDSIEPIEEINESLLIGSLYDIQISNYKYVTEDDEIYMGVTLSIDIQKCQGINYKITVPYYKNNMDRTLDELASIISKKRPVQFFRILANKLLYFKHELDRELDSLLLDYYGVATTAVYSHDIYVAHEFIVGVSNFEFQGKKYFAVEKIKDPQCDFLDPKCDFILILHLMRKVIFDPKTDLTYICGDNSTREISIINAMDEYIPSIIKKHVGV